MRKFGSVIFGAALMTIAGTSLAATIKKHPITAEPKKVQVVGPIEIKVADKKNPPAVTCLKGDDRSSELCAYWAAADAARNANWVAGLGLLVNAVTLGFVWASFRQTQTSTQAALRAAEAAVTAIDSERPWLAPSVKIGGNINRGTFGRGEITSAGVYGTVVWKNYGKRPAQDVGISAKFVLCLEGEDIFTRLEMQHEQWVTIGPGEEKRISASLGFEGFKQANSGIADLYFYSCAIYSDIVPDKAADKNYALYKVIIGDLPEETLGGVNAFQCHLHPVQL